MGEIDRARSEVKDAVSRCGLFWGVNQPRAGGLAAVLINTRQTAINSRIKRRQGKGGNSLAGGGGIGLVALKNN